MSSDPGANKTASRRRHFVGKHISFWKSWEGATADGKPEVASKDARRDLFGWRKVAKFLAI